jgi:anthranilate synthase component II
MSALRTKVLILDHFDSFTFNLFRLVEPFVSLPVRVVRYNLLQESDIRNADKIILSPGPGVPSDYPMTRELLVTYCTVKSFLGVCLGCQAIAEAFGARIFNLPGVYHGVPGVMSWTDPEEYIFKGIVSPWSAGLYHSWAVDPNTLPVELRLSAMTSDGILMALRHVRHDIRGVQFHPESFMTPTGGRIVSNWLQGL